mmetsp:Transcript_80570/g.232910  ORF Transcript_80570/g.232910 Transcript_80570/m.232910 type:complete len:208 (+) Transcript_80570:2159-2782(+)
MLDVATCTAQCMSTQPCSAINGLTLRISCPSCSAMRSCSAPSSGVISRSTRSCAGKGTCKMLCTARMKVLPSTTVRCMWSRFQKRSPVFRSFSSKQTIACLSVPSSANSQKALRRTVSSPLTMAFVLLVDGCKKRQFLPKTSDGVYPVISSNPLLMNTSGQSLADGSETQQTMPPGMFAFMSRRSCSPIRKMRLRVLLVASNNAGHC